MTTFKPYEYYLLFEDEAALLGLDAETPLLVMLPKGQTLDDLILTMSLPSDSSLEEGLGGHFLWP